MRLALPDWDYCRWQVLTPRTKISKPVLGLILIAPTILNRAKIKSAGQVFFSSCQVRLILKTRAQNSPCIRSERAYLHPLPGYRKNGCSLRLRKES